MTLAVFNLLKQQEPQERLKTIQILQSNYSYNKLFNLVDKGKGCIDFSDVFNLLKYYDVSYNFGDNIYYKLYDLVQSLKIDSKSEHKRKIKTTIFGTLSIIKKLKYTNSKSKRYDLIIEFLSVCERNEIKWAIQILSGDKEVRELLGVNDESM